MEKGGGSQAASSVGPDDMLPKSPSNERLVTRTELSASSRPPPAEEDVETTVAATVAETEAIVAKAVELSGGHEALLRKMAAMSPAALSKALEETISAESKAA